MTYDATTMEKATKLAEQIMKQSSKYEVAVMLLLLETEAYKRGMDNMYKISLETLHNGK